MGSFAWDQQTRLHGDPQHEGRQLRSGSLRRPEVQAGTRCWTGWQVVRQVWKEIDQERHSNLSRQQPVGRPSSLSSSSFALDPTRPSRSARLCSVSPRHFFFSHISRPHTFSLSSSSIPPLLLTRLPPRLQDTLDLFPRLLRAALLFLTRSRKRTLFPSTFPSSYALTPLHLTVFAGRPALTPTCFFHSYIPKLFDTHANLL